jgi:hypothetical protein
MEWGQISSMADFNAFFMKNKSHKNSNVLRGFILFIFALIWCEIFLQIGIYQWSGKAFTSFHPYLWSPYGLVRNNPRFNSPGYSINSNGFREIKEYSQVKPPNTIRVMLLGGSVLYAGLGGIPLPGVPRVTSRETISQYLTEELINASTCKRKNVEVINAAVNFNRIAEIAPAYLDDYINWDSDLIIMGSSLNNFAGGITADSRLLGRHPWEAEFQRLVNGTSMASTIEVIARRLSDNFATVAVAKKMAQKISFYLESKTIHTSNVSSSYAKPMVETNTEKLNNQNLERFQTYASAMLAAAKTRNQKIAFFWEHDLWHSGTFKPLSEDEIKLKPLNPNLENPFYWQQRDWVKGFFKNANVDFIDPQIEMSQYKETIFIDYGHYTAGGNKFMAKVIANKILKSNLCHF